MANHLHSTGDLSHRAGRLVLPGGDEEEETKQLVANVKGRGFETKEFRIEQPGTYEIAFRCRPGVTWLQLIRNGKEQRIINFHYNATSQDFRFDVARPGRFKLGLYSTAERDYRYAVTVHRVE